MRLILVAALLLLTACQTSGQSASAIKKIASLPEDADREAVDRQTELNKRGLYLTANGDVKAIPPSYNAASSNWSGKVEAVKVEGVTQENDKSVVIELDEDKN